ncbi:MAG: CopG family ribbon-helix-helix protein [bacterium]
MKRIAIAEMQLDSTSVSTWPEGMEVHFAPEVESRLQQVAQANGKDAEQLVKDAVAHMLERQAIFVAGVNHGIAQADRGELVDHDEVAKRISRLLNP